MSSITVSPQQIVTDFGGKSPTTRAGVQALYQTLRKGNYSCAENSLQAWLAIFRKSCGVDWPRPTAKLEQLAKFYRISSDGLRPEAVLFALHTWYAILVKSLTCHRIASVRRVDSPVGRIDRAAPPEQIRRYVEELGNGNLFAELQVTDPSSGEPFCWCASAWTDSMALAVAMLAERLRMYDAGPLPCPEHQAVDLLKPLYQGLFPRAVRHALGEYYTPNWLADHVLDQVGYAGGLETRLLDPSCGSGTFLMAALRRMRASLGEQSEKSRSGLLQQILHRVVGIDLHPLAALTAQANYILAISDLIPESESVQIPVTTCDAILDHPFEETSDCDGFDFVVGNPPWIAWDNLPNDYREATKEHWIRYGLFSLSGNAARHGGGKKDLSMLLLYASADRYLKRGGRLGMVITQTLFQTKGAGDGFRRFRLGESGEWLRVLQVDDMVAIKPFENAANWTSVVVLKKGEPTQFPISYSKWHFAKDGTAQEFPAGLSKRRYWARPIDVDRSSSPWILQPDGWSTEIGRLVGPSDYQGHLGANSGGANAVYWLTILGREADGIRVRNLADQGKRGIAQVETLLEPNLLYPLVRWGDVDRYHAAPSSHLLLAQDPGTRKGLAEEVMRRDYPRTSKYLDGFESLLTARAAFRRYQNGQPFYSMYNVGPYTLSPAKVVWRRMDTMIRAAVLEEIDDPHLGRRSIVPQETCVLVACASGDEAHYLCAMLNSSVIHFLVTSHSVTGGKGFGTPSVLDYLPVRSFAASNHLHSALVDQSRRAHELAASSRSTIDADAPARSQRSFLRIQHQIDELAAEVLGLSTHDMSLIAEETKGA